MHDYCTEISIALRRKILSMKQRLLAFFTGVTLLCNTVLTASPVLAKSEENKEAPKGNTYYVSTIDGKDSNSGLSDNQALYSLKALSKKIWAPVTMYT